MIEVEQDARVTRIVLNQPEKRNPISVAVLEAILRALDESLSAGGRVVVLSGAGDAFCSGYSLDTGGSDGQVRPRSTVDDVRRLRRLADLMLAIRRHAIFTVAEVHGYCVAGGTDLMLAADIAIAADAAQIGVPNTRALGISLLSSVWPLLIGPMRAKLLMTTGDLISGSQAAAWGLVALSAPQARLREVTTRIAHRISQAPDDMLSAVKLTTNRALDLVGAEALAATAVELDALSHTSEATRAFWSRAKADGLKAALVERDAAFNGDSLTAILAACDAPAAH